MSNSTEFISRRSYNRLVFILVFAFALFWIVFDVNIYHSLLVVILLFTLLFFTDNDIIINQSTIAIKYPYNFLIADVSIPWDNLIKVVVIYRSGLTHGAKSPSSIKFISNQSVKEFNYRLDKEELLTVREIVRSKNVEFECKFCPFSDIE